MTIATGVSLDIKAGNGVTTGFPLNIQIAEVDTLRLYYRAGGVVRELIPDTEFTVGIAENRFATVILTTPPPVGAELLAVRETPLAQGTDFVSNDGLHSATIEASLDRVVLQMQEIATLVKYGLRVDRWTLPGDLPALGVPLPEVDKLLVGTATGWENKTLGDLGSEDITLPVPIAQGGTNAATAAAARANLGVGPVELEWSVPQHFSSETDIRATSGAALFDLETTDTGSSPVGRLRGITNNDGATPFVAAQLSLGAGDRTPGNEDGYATLTVRTNGALNEEVHAEAGVRIGNPTGGVKGLGTLNATGLYVNGVAVPAPKQAHTGTWSVSVRPGSLTRDLTDPGGTATAPIVPWPSAGRPTRVWATLYCVSASSSGGYAVGDEVEPVRGITTWHSDTQFGANWGADIYIHSKDTDNELAITSSAWRLRLHAAG